MAFKAGLYLFEVVVDDLLGGVEDLVEGSLESLAAVERVLVLDDLQYPGHVAVVYLVTLELVVVVEGETLLEILQSLDDGDLQGLEPLLDSRRVLDNQIDEAVDLCIDALALGTVA